MSDCDFDFDFNDNKSNMSDMPDISDIDDFYSNNSNKSFKNVVIDMNPESNNDKDNDDNDKDDTPINYSSKLLGKLVNKKNIITTHNNINTKLNINSNTNSNTIQTDKKDNKNKKNDEKLNEITVSKKLVITKKISNTNVKDQKKEDLKDDKKESNVDDKKETKETNADAKKDSKADNKKETKVDAKFEFNEQTIDFYTREANLNIKDICVKKSQFRNDTVLLCLLFKANIFTEYRCNIKKCKTAKTWLTKPIQLLINRKNGRMEDLTIQNLELICPNCFIVLYGIDLFQKTVNQTIYKCKICNFPLNKFSNIKKKQGYCLACESKIINSTYYSKQSEYINELKETIDNTSALKQDEFTKSNYYNEVSQYKTFKDNGKSNSNNNNILNENNKINNKPIIKLNMNIPDLDELIKEDYDDNDDDDGDGDCDSNGDVDVD